MGSRRPTSSVRFFLAAVLVGSFAFLEACTCNDDLDGIWTFEEPYDDAGGPIDVGEPNDPDDWDWAFPDEEIEPDPPEWEETRWVTEVIEDGVPRSFADNDRTSVFIDRDGTVWLGYHRCYDPLCSNPILVVGHRLANQTEWVWEEIEPHSGLFGLQGIVAGYPIVVYLDAAAGELKAASRIGEGQWLIESLPVGHATAMDGFDVSRDHTRFYVSHAPSSSDTIDFFTYNIAAAYPVWRRLQPLDGARSAAYERGLKGGNQMNFFLVHRDTWGSYLLSEYDLGTDTWTRSTGQFPHAISSLLVRQNHEICTAGPAANDLRVTCGPFEDPRRHDQQIHGSSVYYLSSMIESRDQTLFVAYHSGSSQQDLYVARRPDGGSWETERVFSGDTFGISTAIDHRDHLLMSYYHCTGSSCSLQLTERTP